MYDRLIQLVLVLFGSGIGAALVGWLLDYKREKRARDDVAESLAVRLAIQFEDHAIVCAELLSDHQLAEDTQEQMGSSIEIVPQFEAGPMIDGHKLIDRDLLDKILQFPQECKMAQRAATSLWDVTGDFGAVTDECRKGTVENGIKASEIAKEIRLRNRLPERRLKFRSWDIDRYLGEVARQ